MKIIAVDKGFSKWLSENIKKRAAEVAKNAKGGKCFLCDANCTSYKNSHSIPQFILSNLSSKGEYSNFISLLDTNDLRSIVGKNEAGTFHLICDSCENIELGYEKKELYDDLSKPFGQQVLHDIAIKNLLFLIDKTYREMGYLDAIIFLANKKPFQIPQEYRETLKKYKADAEMKLNCSKNRVCYLVQVLARLKGKLGDNDTAYQVVLQAELSRQVPLALQQAIPVVRGASGEVINDLSGDVNFLHACVFPLENKSLILLFCHTKNNNYDKLASDIKSLNTDDQAKLVNYLIFQYSEDYFCNTDVVKQVKKDAAFLRFCRLKGDSDLSAWNAVAIPNLLSVEYSTKASL